MTQPETTVDAASLAAALDAIDKNVKTAVEHSNYINRDFIALTLAFEELSQGLSETYTKEETDKKRRGFAIAYAGGIFGAVQITDQHVETCRINPVAHRFANPPVEPSKTEQLICDVSFPFHNHDTLQEAGSGLDGYNVVGIFMYLAILLAALAWYQKARVRAARKRVEQDKRVSTLRSRTREIYDKEKEDTGSPQTG